MRQHDLKMIRGGWHWNRRSRDDVLPKDITDEPNRMDEVAYFRKFEKASKEDVERFVASTGSISNKDIMEGAKVFQLTEVPVKKETKQSGRSNR